MKLLSLEIENFRCYQEVTKIDFESLTTIIGKNDIGKSTVLEALEIFFNNDTVKISQEDANIYSTHKNVIITCEFTELPTEIILDSGFVTNLKDEFLLTINDTLKIKKIFDCSKKSVSHEVFIIANHPTASDFDNLLELKESDLRKLISEKSIDSSLKGNPLMRKAIWASCSNLACAEKNIPISKPKEDSKRIWEQIDKYLPLFALFQSDRSSKDSDGEVQDPMKVAVATAIAEVQDDLERIQQRVKERTEEIAKNTHQVLSTLDRSLADALNPEFILPTASKWINLFTVGLNTDGIPLNKRGSGVRRLILVSFFKAEAERILKEGRKKSIIYAIEEPETAQHPNNQKLLQNAFSDLSNEESCQVILTTHSPGFASDLPINSIRFICRTEQSRTPQIMKGTPIFHDVVNTLGVTPDNRVKVICCVEGPTDVKALKALSSALHQKDPTILNLYTDDRVAFVVLGGGNLKHWVSENYLKGFGRKEFHLYDADVPSYVDTVKVINQRGDGSKGFITQKHEIESYLHSEAIKLAFGVEMDVHDHLKDGKAVPRVFAELYSVQQNYDGIMKDTNAKIRLAEKAFPLLTAEMISERDCCGEVENWFRTIAEMIEN